MTWDAAKKHCEDDGAKLISLRNEWSQAYVELLSLNLKAPLWIGMNKKETKGYFRYIDGWHMTFSHWGPNEPGRDKPCVYMDVDGKWKTAACNQTMNSVCMKSTDVPPTESPDFPGVCPEDPDITNTGRNNFWIPFRGYCYIFFTEEKRWPDASTSCARHGGSLASIGDPTEQDFIQKKAKIFQDNHSSFWIGLFKNNKGEWLWWDRAVMDYTNWDEYQPSDQKFGGITTSDGTWKADHSYYSRPYICKTPKVLPSIVSSSSPPGPQLSGRGHIALAVVIVITGIVMGAVIAFFLFKKNRHRLPIPAKLTAFDNPLFFSNGQTQPNVVDSNILVQNAEEENCEPAVGTM